MVYIIKFLDHPKKGVSKIFVDYVDIVDKLIYNITGIILQTPSRDKPTHHKGGKMKIKLLENDKIIEVPNYWKWHLVEGEKVIIDQNKKIIAIVVEE
jgi:hypothetical protein